jgi:glyoxylase I family protein
MKAKINHIAILITDLQKAREFYGKILGFEEIERPNFMTKGLWYNLGDIELHLMLYEQAASPQVHPLNETVQPHFALSISKNEIIMMIDRLKNFGVKLATEICYSPAGLLQVFFYDFDNNMIEFNEG